MIATLLHSFSATSSTCVEKKIAPPFAQCSAIRFLSWCDATGSSPTNGSSIRISFGLWISAEMIAIFCFMPCEHSEIAPPSASVMPSSAPSSAMRFSRSSFVTP